tara:strand:+ start:871 stop:1476 length:606 start_codon:yes stop_codon:yes gene_type:complete
MSNRNTKIIIISSILFSCILFFIFLILILFIIIKGKKEIQEASIIFNILFDQEQRTFDVILRGMKDSRALLCDVHKSWTLVSNSVESVVNSIVSGMEKVMDFFGAQPQKCNESSFSCPIDNTTLDSYCAGNPCISTDFGDNSNCCLSPNNFIENVKIEAKKILDTLEEKDKIFIQNSNVCDLENGGIQTDEIYNNILKKIR